MTQAATQLQLPWVYARSLRVSAAQLLEWADIKAPPVPVEHICRRLGVQVHPITDPGWDGALKVENGQAHIWYNSGVAPTRQRFTVAHELGHLVLHDGDVEFRDRITLLGVSPKERQANKFAAELLMPEWWINAFSPGRTVDVLASIFEVSPQAMGIRLQALRRGQSL